MSPKEAFEYCKTKNCRMPELENIIAIDPYFSYRYACDVIKCRWEKGEQIIATNSYYSYWYARYVIKDPFHLCHHIIFNSEWRDEYIGFLKSINCDLNEIGEWLI